MVVSVKNRAGVKRWRKARATDETGKSQSLPPAGGGWQDSKRMKGRLLVFERL